MAQLTERFGFDLSNTLSGYVEVLSNFLKGVVTLLADAKPHPENLFFAGRQR